MRRLTMGLPVCALLLALAGLPRARAEDDAPPAVPHGDFLVAVQAIEDGLGRFDAPPGNPGFEEAHAKAWRSYAKPRIRRMRRRCQTLAKPELWGRPPADPHPATSLDPESWSSFVKHVGGLYVELGSLRDRYAGMRFDGRRAQVRWLRRFPAPDPIGIVPSRRVLEDVEAQIRAYQAMGRAVPGSLYAERSRIAQDVAREEAAERERQQRLYDERKRVAFETIETDVLATRSALQADVDALSAGQRALRRLVAAAQALEEARLQTLVAAAPTVGDHLAKVPEHLADMAVGRREAERFTDDRDARWGSLLRQGWMIHREKLLRALRKAEKAAAEAAAAAAEPAPAGPADDDD